MTTAKDVAERAGTSTAVVSYVFNDGPRPVSAPTRAKVIKAAAELNYRPHAAARALTMGRTDSFGLVIPSIQNPFFGELAHAVEIAAKASGHLLLIADSAMDPEQEKRQIDAFVGRRVDGIILVSCETKQDVRGVVSNGIPIVALHPVAKEQPVQSVHMNYSKAAEALTEHLLSVHDVKSLLLMTAVTERGGSRDHRRGVTAAIDKHSKPVALFEVRADVARESSSQVAIEYLKTHPYPEAIYCATDEQAYGVLSALNTLGISVPEEIKVVGFDGTRHSEFSVPTLTTVRQPLETIAARAVELLTSDDPGPLPLDALDGKLVIRRSCGC
jgi:LacI family transcriptional regulator